MFVQIKLGAFDQYNGNNKSASACAHYNAKPEKLSTNQQQNICIV